MEVPSSSTPPPSDQNQQCFRRCTLFFRNVREVLDQARKDMQGEGGLNDRINKVVLGFLRKATVNKRGLNNSTTRKIDPSTTNQADVSVTGSLLLEDDLTIQTNAQPPLFTNEVETRSDSSEKAKKDSKDKDDDQWFDALEHQDDDQWFDAVEYQDDDQWFDAVKKQSRNIE